MSTPNMRRIPLRTRGKPWGDQVKVWLFESQRWEITEDYNYLLPNGRWIVIPKGFIFDGASIPRPFWFLLSPTGLLLIPGLLHDYAYKYNQLIAYFDGKRIPYLEGAGRAYWDDMFKRIGKEVNGMSVVSDVTWAFLYLFGGFAWNKHRKNDA